MFADLTVLVRCYSYLAFTQLRDMEIDISLRRSSRCECIGRVHHKTLLDCGKSSPGCRDAAHIGIPAEERPDRY
jgi:hypothetical protein